MMKVLNGEKRSRKIVSLKQGTVTCCQSLSNATAAGLSI